MSLALSAGQDELDQDFHRMFCKSQMFQEQKVPSSPIWEAEHKPHSFFFLIIGFSVGFFFFFLIWGIVTLQCCVSFCCTMNMYVDHGKSKRVPEKHLFLLY